MENMMLLLFFLASGDESLRASLRSFLSFYKENRDLIHTLMQTVAPMSGMPPEKTQTEDRPREEVGRNKILEDYLSRLG